MALLAWSGTIDQGAQLTAKEDSVKMAQTPKKRPNPTKKLTQAEQSKRFKETARKIGMSEDPEDFERVFRKIAPPKWRSKDDPEGGQG
jgi:hypothetical protein